MYRIYVCCSPTRRSRAHLLSHLDLELIATDPADQKRGAASLLLRQLAEIADEAKQSIHLLATDAARPVYAKNGFEVLDEIVLDLAEMNESKPGRERFTVSHALTDLQMVC